MEIRLRVLLLSVLLALPGCASIKHLFGKGDKSAAAPTQAQTEQAARDDTVQAPPKVIEPEVERRKVKVPRIRSQNWEVGGYFGTLNIEDFGAHPVYGVQAAYHVTEDFFFQAEAGRSKGGRTSFETLSGNIQLLTDSERWFKYYDLSLGYNFLPGEVFLGRNFAMISSFYVLAGAGSTNFGGDQKFTVNFGAGYRVLPADWIAVHVAVEDRVFNSDLLGVSKLASNLEAHIGATFFF
ncbi:MAG TPA: outer membrane beta-barrel domain-containing protein [Steroidobacteraceae bacterium]|nr:outer membrane beta-barrel domain-containing protein [Steroidobacteraceae bacterium]